MKKLAFVMPLMAISLLASCGGTPQPSGTFTITFKNEGEEDKKIENIEAGSIVTEGIPTPTKQPEDAEFIGWCTDTESKNVFDFSKIKIYQDYTLYSGWKTSTYTVTLDAGEGTYITGQKYNLYVKKESNLSKNIKTIAPPYLSGKTFAYYTYSDGTAIDYDDVVTSDITLEANYLPTTAPTDDLTKFDWKTIRNIAVTGNPSQWFKIGATKKVKINEKDHIVKIIDFNHDYSELPDEGNPDPNKVLGITFEFANVITDSNGNAVTTIWDGEYEVSGNNYDYRKSVLNTFLNNDVLNMLPSSGDLDNPDLKEVIKPVDKKVGVNESETEGSQYYTAISYDGETYPYPYLFLLAYDEMANNGSWVTEGEGTKYQYYEEYPNQADRIKRKVGIESGNGEGYWIRSPRANGSYGAWIVGIDGRLRHYSVYSFAFAVAPAFCI
ncbi:MAG: DUF6273 domain-containing protein [Bacilli bacterium]|nr:DUF6273 domain-containing protein [Bacilli bacterium]